MYHPVRLDFRQNPTKAVTALFRATGQCCKRIPKMPKARGGVGRSREISVPLRVTGKGRGLNVLDQTRIPIDFGLPSAPPPPSHLCHQPRAKPAGPVDPASTEPAPRRSALAELVRAGSGAGSASQGLRFGVSSD
eukprot:scaffold98880_cov63-Phaeocystis_antarctica.AAC.3